MANDDAKAEDSAQNTEVSDNQTLTMLHNTTHLSGLTLRERILLRFLVLKAETASFRGDGDVDTEVKRK